MVDEEQFNLLKQGVATWNQWRKEHPTILPMLQHANLSNWNLNGTNLSDANLSFADLSHADLSHSNLSFAHSSNAYLSNTNLCGANLSDADLSGANLNNVNLTNASLIRTDLSESILIHSLVYGISVWDVRTENSRQDSLTITPSDQPTITVDNLEVAQFVHLLLNNKKALSAINTISTKIVLILGQFLLERRSILEAITSELRKRNYLPVLFDFNRPHNKKFTEMLITLAHLSHFIIADFTNEKSIPLELQANISRLRIPIQPLSSNSKYEDEKFDFLNFYPWVLPMYRYESIDDLLLSLNERVIEPGEQQAAS